MFVTTALNKPREHRVTCYRARDGQRLWETLVQPGPWLLTDLRGGYGAPTPASDGERVMAVFGSAVVVCLDFDGHLRWRHELKDYNFDVAMGSSPLTYRDTFLLLCDQNKGTSSLIAFDRGTGAVKWETRRDTAFAHSTPVVVQVNGRSLLLDHPADSRGSFLRHHRQGRANSRRPGACLSHAQSGHPEVLRSRQR